MTIHVRLCLWAVAGLAFPLAIWLLFLAYRPWGEEESAFFCDPDPWPVQIVKVLLCMHAAYLIAGIWYLQSGRRIALGVAVVELYLSAWGTLNAYFGIPDQWP